MKNKLSLIAYPIAAALVVSSCRKTPPAPATAPVNTAASDAEVAVPEQPVTPPVAPADRASKLGFAQMLPKDTETLVLVQNGKEVVKRVKASKIFGFAKSQNPSLDDSISGDGTGGMTALDFLGDELFLATGKSTDVQTGHLMKTSNRSNYFQFRSLLEMIISSAKGEEPDLESLDPIYSQIALVQDAETGLALLKASEMPPSYLGVKCTKENQEKIQQAFSGLIGNLAAQNELGDALEEITVEKDGRSFKGSKLVGKKLVAQWRSNEGLMGMLEEKLDQASLDELFTLLGEKNVIAVTGTVNDYVVGFVGSREEDLKLAATPADSFATSDSLKFVDTFLEKNPVFVSYAKGSVLSAITNNSGISYLTDAFRDALASSGEVDTREIEALLDVVKEREREMSSSLKISDLGMVGYFEEGFKLETFGGSNMPSIIASANNKLGAIGDSKDVAIFANWTSNPAYTIKTNEYLESLAETVYAMAKNVSTWQLGEENQSFAAFKQYVTLFDESFSDHVVTAWDSMSSDFPAGLGNETAFVIDLNGEMPPIPNVPQELVKSGKFPRISYLKPVKDRSKLVSAWEKINQSGEGIMGEVSKMMEQEQAMPKPMSSKDNGLITWFFAGPLFTDDFAPSVTLDDTWFVASTSKNHAVDLAKQAGSSASGKTGAFMRVDFDALRACAKHWVKAVDDNKDAIFESNPSAGEDFTENKKMIMDGLKAFGEMDELTLHSREESGTSRSTIHFKTR